MARLRKIIDESLFSGTGVNCRPSNGAHVKFLPDGTTVASSSISAATDFFYYRLRHKCKKLWVVLGGKVASVTGLGEAASLNDTEWNTPLYVWGYSTPYVDPKVDYWSQYWAVKQAIDMNQSAKVVNYGGTQLAGIHGTVTAEQQNQLGVSLCSSSSQPPRILPGIAWGTVDSTGGESTDMPAVGDYVGGSVQIGNANFGNVPNVADIDGTPHTVELDCEGIDGLWLAFKCVWPVNTVVTYTAAAYTLDMDLRLVGLGE